MTILISYIESTSFCHLLTGTSIEFNDFSEMGFSCTEVTLTPFIQTLITRNFQWSYSFTLVCKNQGEGQVCRYQDSLQSLFGKWNRSGNSKILWPCHRMHWLHFPQKAVPTSFLRSLPILMHLGNFQASTWSSSPWHTSNFSFWLSNLPTYVSPTTFHGFPAYFI